MSNNTLYKDGGALRQAQLGQPAMDQGDPQQQEVGATEEEQQQYDVLMLNANEFIHGNEKRANNIVRQLKRFDEPFKSVGLLAAQISFSSLGAAKRNEVEVDPVVALQSNIEVVEELLDVGIAAGVFEFAEGDDKYQQVARRAIATSVHGLADAATASGLLDAGKMRDAMQNLQASSGAGEVEKTVREFSKLTPDGVSIMDEQEGGAA